MALPFLKITVLLSVMLPEKSLAKKVTIYKSFMLKSRWILGSSNWHDLASFVRWRPPPIYWGSHYFLPKSWTRTEPKYPLDRICSPATIWAVDYPSFTRSLPPQALTFWGIKWEGGVTRRWSCEASKRVVIPFWRLFYFILQNSPVLKLISIWPEVRFGETKTAIVQVPSRPVIVNLIL